MHERSVFPESSEKVLHHFAYSCYNQGMWQKAISTFRLLAMYCPQNGAYWYGLGSSLMMHGNDEEAAHAFQIATICSPDDPRPFAFWAECTARQGNKEFAAQIIAQAEVKAKQAEYSAFQEQIQVIKERVVEVTHGQY